VSAATLHVALGAASSNAMRLRDLLEAQARVIPAPTSPQDVAVWLNRAPSLAWLSYTALGYTRSVPAAPLPDVLAGVMRERAAWESRDKGLVTVFAQREVDARKATPTLPQRPRPLRPGEPPAGVGPGDAVRVDPGALAHAGATARVAASETVRGAARGAAHDLAAMQRAPRRVTEA
jgi:hypothetical protein